MKLINICNKVIEFSFYAIFLLIPLAIAGDTSELFEFNKMWLAFCPGIIIAVSSIIKSMLKKNLEYKELPLIFLFFFFFCLKFYRQFFPGTAIFLFGDIIQDLTEDCF